MNKQLAFIITAGLAVFGLIGVVVVIIVKPESTDQIMKYVVQLLLIIGGFAGLTVMQNQQAKAIERQADTLEKVKDNTNGTLTKRDEEISVLRAALAKSDPEALVAVDTATIDTNTNK